MNKLIKSAVIVGVLGFSIISYAGTITITESFPMQNNHMALRNQNGYEYDFPQGASDGTFTLDKSNWSMFCGSADPTKDCPLKLYNLNNNQLYNFVMVSRDPDNGGPLQVNCNPIENPIAYCYSDNIHAIISAPGNK